jgi:hypothetical protein
MKIDPPPDAPRPPDDFWSRRRMLARFSFSFLIVAVFLGYTAYHGSQNHELSQGRVILYSVAAMLSFVMFMLGTRERHRPRDED